MNYTLAFFESSLSWNTCSSCGMIYRTMFYGARLNTAISSC